MKKLMQTEAGKAAVLIVGLTALVSVLLLAFALPGVHSKPNHVPLAVSAPATMVDRIATTLSQKQPGAFDITVVDSESQARQQILERDVDGAIVVGQGGVTTMVATAASPTVATLIGGVGQTMATSMKQPHALVDVRGFGSGDPKGVGLSAGALPLALGGWIGAVVLMMLIRRPRTLVAATIGFAAVGGAALILLLRFVTGTFDGNVGYLWLAGMLGIAATAFTVIGLRSLLGGAGLGIAAIILVLLGNPLSGLAGSPDLLPRGWGALGQLLPPGALGTLLRNVGFFDGHHITQPIVVLSAWLAVGVAFYSIAIRRHVDITDDDELIDEVVGVEPHGAGHTEPHPGAHREGGRADDGDRADDQRRGQLLVE